MMQTTRKQRQALKAENRKRPPVLTPIPKDMWPRNDTATRFQVWVSRDYLVQEFNEPGGIVRLSVNRTTMRADGRWDDRLTWDELQEIKRQVGFAESYAIEVYPRDADLVNDANMRHLWILSEPLDIGWFEK